MVILLYFCWWRPKRRQDYTTDGQLEKPELPASSAESPDPIGHDPHLTKAELDNTQKHELEGSRAAAPVGLSKGNAVFEMPAREEVASELRAGTTAHEILTPDTLNSEAPLGEFPWRKSGSETNSMSPVGSPRSLGSPRILGMEGIVSPVSTSTGLSSPISSLSMFPGSVPSPLPSPPLFSVQKTRR
jgi:hypothetical protein